VRRMRVVEEWTEAPLERFVTESGARLTLLMTPAGQVLAQHGFTRAVDVMAAASLGAAIMATARELARMLEEAEFSALAHQGRRHGIFLGSLEGPRGPLLALVVYGADSSEGLVQLFFEELIDSLAAAAVPPAAMRRPLLAADFERELNESLASLFGR
jgi:hypothetical protein